MRSDIMKSSYVILKEKKLILEVLIGIVNIQNIKMHRDILYTDKQYSSYYDILIDITDAKIALSMDELTEYMNYLASKSQFLNNRKVAILSREKNVPLYGHAFKEFNSKMPLQYNVLGSCDECVKWLDKDELQPSCICTSIKEMKNEPHLQWFNRPNAITGF